MTNATNATVEETAKLFNIALAGDKYEFTGATKDVVIDEGGKLDSNIQTDSCS